MRGKKHIFIAVLILVIMVAAAACAKKSDSAEDRTSDSNYGGYMTESANTSVEEGTGPEFDTQDDKLAQYSVSNNDSGQVDTDITNSSVISADGGAISQIQDKIIRTFYLEVETQTFDSLMTKLNSEISRLDGYVESSRISGKSYYDSDGALYASIVARIPKSHVDEFVNTVGEKANVTDKQESTENVTLNYADIESRKKALEIEQERLFALLEKTDNLENIVTLESRLSDIRYELQNYETTLRTYDNKVDYSTVTLSIQEVKKLTPATTIKQPVGTRIKNGFSNTMYKLSEGFQNFIVWFVVNLPYLFLWAAAIIITILIVKKVRRKIDKKQSSHSQIPPEDPQ